MRTSLPLTKMLPQHEPVLVMRDGKMLWLCFGKVSHRQRGQSHELPLWQRSRILRRFVFSRFRRMSLNEIENRRSEEIENHEPYRLAGRIFKTKPIRIESHIHRASPAVSVLLHENNGVTAPSRLLESLPHRTIVSASTLLSWSSALRSGESR